MSTRSLLTTELPEAETEERQQVKRKCQFETTATPCVALLTLPRPRSYSSKCHTVVLYIIGCLNAEVNVGVTTNVCLFKVTIFDQNYCCSN